MCYSRPGRGPTGQHKPDPQEQSWQAAADGDLYGSGMEVADHVRESPVRTHLKLVWVSLHAGESHTEERMLANDVGGVSPDQKTILSAWVGAIEPAEAATRMEPPSSGDERYCHYDGCERAR